MKKFVLTWNSIALLGLMALGIVTLVAKAWYQSSALDFAILLTPIVICASLIWLNYLLGKIDHRAFCVLCILFLVLITTPFCLSYIRALRFQVFKSEFVDVCKQFIDQEGDSKDMARPKLYLIDGDFRVTVVKETDPLMLFFFTGDKFPNSRHGYVYCNEDPHESVASLQRAYRSVVKLDDKWFMISK